MNRKSRTISASFRWLAVPGEALRASSASLDVMPLPCSHETRNVWRLLSPDLSRGAVPCPMGPNPLYRPQRNQMFYAPWLCPQPSSAALAAFGREIMAPTHRHSALLQARDALLIDNRRIQHMRDELPVSSPR